MAPQKRESEMSVKEFKAVLGFNENNNKAYLVLRDDIISYAITNGIKGIVDTEKAHWTLLEEHAIAHKFLTHFRATFEDDTPPEYSKVVKKALKCRCIDAIKKKNAARSAADRLMVELGDYNIVLIDPTGAAAVTAVATAAAGLTDTAILSRVIRYHIINPDTWDHNEKKTADQVSGYDWSPETAFSLKLTTFVEPVTLCDLLTYAVTHIPQGHFLLAVYRALTAFTDNNLNLEPNDMTWLTHDDKMTAWLGTTTCMPPAVKIILHRVERSGNPKGCQIPPPLGETTHISKRYFDSILEDEDEEFDNPFGKKRRMMPRTDRGYQLREHQIWRRIRCQQTLLVRVKELHVETTPDAMFSNEEEYVSEVLTALQRVTIRDGLKAKKKKLKKAGGVKEAVSFPVPLVPPPTPPPVPPPVPTLVPPVPASAPPVVPAPPDGATDGA